MVRHILLLWVVAVGCACSAGRGVHNHVMHPDWQVAFVREQVGQGHEPYAAAYGQLLHYADSVQGQRHHALADFPYQVFTLSPRSTVPIRWLSSRMLLPLIVVPWPIAFLMNGGTERKPCIF